jgi:hypothetical protein
MITLSRLGQRTAAKAAVAQAINRRILRRC